MNIYWPIYLNIESEINKLMYAIHMDDSHLNVHSSIISDLILRCCAEIESLAKELYKNNGGPKKSGIKYDYDALKFLDDNWMISKKKVLISSINCFFSKVELTPFAKDTPKTDSPGKLTYMWNNAYQNLKHDRRNGLQYGNVAALFSAVAALYTLNLYYKDETFNGGTWRETIKVDLSMGSTVFSIGKHVLSSLLTSDTVWKGDEYHESIIVGKPDDTDSQTFRSILKEHEDLRRQYTLKFLVREVTPGMPKDEIDNLAAQANLESFKQVPRELSHKLFQTEGRIKMKYFINKNQF